MSGGCRNTWQCEALEQRKDTKQAKRHQAGQVWNNQGGAEKSGVDTPGNEWRRDIAKCWKHLAMKGKETPGGRKDTKKIRRGNIKKVRRGDMRLV